MPEPRDSQSKHSAKKPGKELYRQLRALTCEQLWNVEVPRFAAASAQERIARVTVIRAVSTVFAASGSDQQRDAARQWLRSLLADPSEKVRRYAASALPVLGAEPSDEAAMLAVLKTSHSEREKQALGQALAKIGGAATLAQMHNKGGDALHTTGRRVQARLARAQNPSAIDTLAKLADVAGLRVHLRVRRGYQHILAAEVEDRVRRRGQFRVDRVGDGLVALTPIAPFALRDLYELRCFDTVGLVLGSITEAANVTEALAAMVVSTRSQHVLRALTHGALRYRLDFVAKGPQRAAVQRVADRAYALWPEFLNDPSQAPWTIAVHPAGRRQSVELVPHLIPDPRLAYRQGDIPAASHPRLASCMARLAGPMRQEVVWDPFCGSGMELIERALLGGVRRVHGSDIDADALRIGKLNFEAAKLNTVQAEFSCCDFRDFKRIRGLDPGSVSLIVTNPPMGRRVHTPDVHRVVADLMSVADAVLRPGGRLVFPNPVRTVAPPQALALRSRQVVDFGGFDCRLEVYEKLG